jgi:hemolysin III
VAQVTRAARVKPAVRPTLRGVSHQYAFLLAVAAGVVLVVLADGALARVGAAAFAVAVALMFGVSAVYHRVTWRPRPRRWMARADHAAIFVLIAGTYTPFALVALSGAWRISVLVVIWSGALLATAFKFAWVDAPKALAAVIAVLLGWAGVAAMPQIIARIGIAPTTLLIAGGAFYTVGALVYAFRRPNPSPRVFGYHEIFHAFVVAAVACHYVGVTIYLA